MSSSMETLTSAQIHLQIAKSQAETVYPAEETPRQVLNLSILDNQMRYRFHPALLLVYKQFPNATATLKQALAKALVYYYPLAGRLQIKDPITQELEVDCSAQGAIFIEAEAHCTLADFNYGPWTDELLPPGNRKPSPEHYKEPILGIQVTRFLCGGVVLGISTSHVIADGSGISKFVGAMANIAVGKDPPYPPSWRRDMLMPRKRPMIGVPVDTIVYRNPESATPEPPTAVKSEYTFSRKAIEALKTEALRDAPPASRCTVFEAVVAYLWRTRSRILLRSGAVAPEANAAMGFGMSMAEVAALPQGFYGKTTWVVHCVVACAKSVEQTKPKYSCRQPFLYVAEQARLWDLVEIIQDTKRYARSPEYLQSVLDYLQIHGVGSSVNVLTLDCLPINDWSRLTAADADFGWGAPVSCYRPPSSVWYLTRPASEDLQIYRDGVRVTVNFPTSQAMQEFSHDFDELHSR